MKLNVLLLASFFSTQVFAQEDIQLRRFVDGKMYWVDRKISASSDPDFNYQIEEYYENGNLYQRFYALERPSKSTALSGGVERYFYNGQLKSKGYYEQGTQVGDHVEYYASGNLKAQSQNYLSGKVKRIFTEFFDVKAKVIKLESYNFIKPKKDSTCEFYKNGQLKSIRLKVYDEFNKSSEKLTSLFSLDGEQLVKNGFGKIEKKDSTGRVILSGTYLSGFKVGSWQEYVENEGTYEDHFSENGKLVDGIFESLNGQKITYDHREKIPEFNEGRQGLYLFLARNLSYPKEARDLKLAGKVIVKFMVDPLGQVSDIQILKSLHPLLDEEAKRVVQLTNGKWKPGFQRGRAIKVMYTLPVNFKSL